MLETIDSKAPRSFKLPAYYYLIISSQSITEYLKYGVRGVNDSPAEITPKSSQPKEEMTPLGNNDSP